MPHQANISLHLERAFQTWQTQMIAAMIKAPPLAQASYVLRLPEFILDKSVKTAEMQAWTLPPDFTDSLSLADQYLYRRLRNFPLELFDWNRKSKRAFDLPNSLLSVFLPATFPNMKWGDIRWKYDAFIVALEARLKAEIWSEGEILQEAGHDMALVTRRPLGDGGKYLMSVRIFDAELDPRVRFGLSRGQVAEVKKGLEEGRSKRAIQLATAVVERVNGLCRGRVPPGADSIELVVDPERQIDTRPETLAAIEHQRLAPENSGLGEPGRQAMEEQRYGSISRFLNIILGWMLYQESLQPSDVRWGNPPKPKLMVDSEAAGVITTPEGVCKLLGKARMDDAVRRGGSGKQREGGQGFKKPHWRGRVYRRPWGSDPDHPKTVEIAPVLIRPDLVPLYGIVGGTRTRVVDRK